MITPAPEGSVALAPAAAETLPTWDLSDLYESPESPRIEADLARAEADARAFSASHAGKLAALSGRELAVAMEFYQAIDEILGRVMSYAQLLFSADSTDAEAGRFYQVMMERCTGISAHTLFFRLELNRIEDSVLEEKFADPAFAHWRPYLRDLRVWRKHQLSDELERFVHEREVTGRAAWSRLFDETIAGMRIPFGGEQLSVNAVLNKLSDPDSGDCGDGGGPCFLRPRKTVFADHEYLGQGQGDSRYVAAFPQPRNRTQFVQCGGG
jgi:oligoendopeptidase F